MKKMFVLIALSGLLAGCASNRDESAGTFTGLRVISEPRDEPIGTDRGSLGTGIDTGTGTSGQDAMGGAGTLDQRSTGSGSSTGTLDQRTTGSGSNTTVDQRSTGSSSDTSTGSSRIGTSGAGTSGAPASGVSRSGVR